MDTDAKRQCKYYPVSLQVLSEHSATFHTTISLKETQLNHVEVDQNVTVELDAYPNHVWKAKVGSISPATGAEFSVLPPQNASGNWVKVVQRLPVRIEIQSEEGQPKLRAGMTATVSIDTLHQRDLWSSIKSGFSELVADNITKGNS